MTCPTREVSLEAIERVLSEWDIREVSDVSADSVGTLNQTWLITADKGRFALRLSGHRDSDRHQRECDLMRYAGQSGVPVVEPCLSESGLPFIDRDGLWMLTPFAPGSQIHRDALTLDHDRGMGRYLARLLEVLRGCPHPPVRLRNLKLDPERALEKIADYERKIRDWPNSTEQEAYALDRLNGRRKWIEAHPDATLEGIERLDQQVIHGDYQEKNVFFDEAGDVVAVIDWENAWNAPREWEILRTLDIVMRFDPGRGTSFIEGYVETAGLNLDDLDRAALSYAAERTHQVYLFEEIYDKRNDRARQFLNPGPFKPVYERWVPLRNALQGIL